MPREIRPIFQAAEAKRAQILVPSIVVVEAILLLQRRRIPESSVDKLLHLSESPDADIFVFPLNLAVVQALHYIGPGVIPELSDRIIAATARAMNVPLLTTDMIIIESGLVKVVG